MSASALARLPKSCDDTVSVVGDHGGAPGPTVGRACGATAKDICGVRGYSSPLPRPLVGISGLGCREYLVASPKSDGDDDDAEHELSSVANENDALRASPPSR